MPLPSAVAQLNKSVTNRVMIHLAGHGPFVALEHVGRRSGALYLVPLNAFRDGDTVTVALTYGPRVDWLRNVRAAGGCRMRMGRDMLTLGAPTDLHPQVGLSRMPWVARPVLRLTKVTGFVEMPVLSQHAAYERP